MRTPNADSPKSVASRKKNKVTELPSVALKASHTGKSDPSKVSTVGIDVITPETVVTRPQNANSAARRKKIKVTELNTSVALKASHTEKSDPSEVSTAGMDVVTSETAVTRCYTPARLAIKTPDKQTPDLSTEDTDVTPVSDQAQPASSTRRVTRKVVRKVLRKVPAARVKLLQTPKVVDVGLAYEDKAAVPEEDNVSAKDVESPTRGGAAAKEGVELLDSEEEASPVPHVSEETVVFQDKGKAKVDAEEPPTVDAEEQSLGNAEQLSAADVGDLPTVNAEELLTADAGELPTVDAEELPTVSAEKPPAGDAEKLSTADPGEANKVLGLVEPALDATEPGDLEVKEVQQEEGKQNMSQKEDEPQSELEIVNQSSNEDTKNKSNLQKGDEDHAVEGMVEYGEDEAFIEPSKDDFQEDDGLDNVEDVKTSEEERRELNAAFKERKLRRELEVFVSGLDREVVEDDLKKAFEKVGEVVEVRLLKDPTSNRSRGFAFVRFAKKDQVKRALSEMKNPVLRGKRCGTSPCEDNDVLFVGNICNTWTKEAIKQKLKDYGVNGVESITLVQDPRQEGLSRGFCFIQFACHADAMVAYKRLQKPDAIFGHAERTAKVAFAEPLREPDPEVMAKVKSVFIDGLPPHWDEDRVRENLKHYGEIERITLARNMSSAKRKDFGFVDFKTHEAAIACIGDVNAKELGDGSSKARVRARLSNPMPKTQAVKGGMCGGFRIGRGGAIGRGFGRSNRPFERPSFQYGRPGFHQRGRGQFVDPMRQYPDFHERRQYGFAGRRVPFRESYPPSTGIVNARNNFSGVRHGLNGRGLTRPPASLREPIVPEEETYARPFTGRYMDDPYLYDDRAPGMKRPLYMPEQEPSYMEPSRVRPRFDYSNPVYSDRYRESYGAGSSMFSSGYYGSDYAAGPARHYPPFRGSDSPFGGGYYY